MPAVTVAPARSVLLSLVATGARYRTLDLAELARYQGVGLYYGATYIEAQWEIERLLEISDVGLCLDTGHLLLGRGDPVTAVRDWGARINQVHLKDAKLAKLSSDARFSVLTEPALGRAVTKLNDLLYEFTSQMDLGRYLTAQYHIRTANELSSCETCHR